jgi:hypothetical protein
MILLLFDSISLRLVEGLAKITKHVFRCVILPKEEAK